MIGKISGLLEEKTTHSALINIHGLSYEVELPLTTAFALPDVGQPVTLFTHFVVREDAQLLYGFARKDDREMFRTLIRVNGVGPKVALSILSGMSSESLINCVKENEVSLLVKLPGIGKKTAERLLIELRDKVNALQSSSLRFDSDASIPSVVSIYDEAESALIALGYKPQDASKAVKNAKSDNQTLESLIKTALKNML